MTSELIQLLKYLQWPLNGCHHWSTPQREVNHQKKVDSQPEQKKIYCTWLCYITLYFAPLNRTLMLFTRLFYVILYLWCRNTAIFIKFQFLLLKHLIQLLPQEHSIHACAHTHTHIPHMLKQSAWPFHIFYVFFLHLCSKSFYNSKLRTLCKCKAMCVSDAMCLSSVQSDSNCWE